MIGSQTMSEITVDIELSEVSLFCRYMLAHVFSKEGDTIGYLYDFGDKWYHEVVVRQLQQRGAILHSCVIDIFVDLGGKDT